MVTGAQIGNRPTLLSDIQLGMQVRLVREPDNPVDSNAIQIVLENGDVAGYMPRSEAEEVAPVLDTGYTYEATIVKILAGKVGNIPVVQAYFNPPGRWASSRTPEPRRAEPSTWIWDSDTPVCRH
jgi:hypothetical protein